ALSRPPEVGRCCPCHSPTLRPWIAALRLRCRRIVVLRGEALEPGARIARRKSAGKNSGQCGSLIFPRPSTRGPFSLWRGLEMDYCFFKLSITLCVLVSLLLKRRKATLSDRPRYELLCG